MCGIFGFVARRELPAAVVLEGLRYLEYRGYDSWGIAAAHEGSAVTEKAVGQIGQAQTSLPPAQVALGHTRWATHGGVTAANAHPHTDCSGHLALIHNGIVENHQELRALLQHEHRWCSQTDTEVLVHLLEEMLDSVPDLLQALLAVFRQVEGLSAVAVLDSRSGQVAVAKNGSPLALGWGDEVSLLASDAGALLDHTQRVTFLEDGQAALLGAGDVRVVEIESGRLVQPSIHTLNWDAQRAGLEGYPHFMAKEIHEQPRILHEIADCKGQEARELAEMVRSARDVTLIGCGTAHHAAISGRYMLARLGGRATQTAVASELGLLNDTLGPGSLVIALSQSGETIDVLEAVKEARARGAQIAALVNAPGSALDRFADISVHLNCGPERCVLATKSYTAKLAVLRLVSRALRGELDLACEELRQAARCTAATLDRVERPGLAREIATRIQTEQHMFVLGRHENHPLALEVALKVKEVSYMHAEGFAAGELKHGVIALVTYGTPCLILAPDDRQRREILAAAAEVRARGAHTIGLSPRPEEEFDVTIPISGGAASMFEIAAATQVLAYELALARGCDPDKPRNLAKSVTVK